MRVILQVTAGPAQGRQIPLQSGERARFGRSDLADVCFPEDSQMSDVHFELECQADQCLVRDLAGSGGTFVNAQQVAEAAVVDGDEIVAGQTQLRTVVQGHFRSAESEARTPVPKTEQPMLSAIELCQLTSLEEDSLKLFRPHHSPDDFIRELAEHHQFADAIRILTLYLPKRKTIFWALRGVEEVFPRELVARERDALVAVQKWLDDGCEENRRALMAIAEEMEYSNAASCVAAAACWSEGSMGPAEFADVPADPKLTAQVASAALMMTATEGEVQSIGDRYKKLVQIGQKILSGEIEVPESKR